MATTPTFTERDWVVIGTSVNEYVKVLERNKKNAKTEELGAVYGKMLTDARSVQVKLG